MSKGNERASERPTSVVLAVFACLLAGTALAQFVVPDGDQVQVNSFTTGRQTNPTVGVDSSGGFVMAWASEGSFGTDASLTSIQGQRFAADGTPLEGEFQVNTTTDGYQLVPAVAARPTGEFVVAWGSSSSAGSDSFYSVQVQRFNAGGLPVGGELQVNTYTIAVQEFPAVSWAADGGFLVVWHSQGSFGGDSLGRSIQGQRFSDLGVPVGGELQLNTFTAGDQVDPAVARLETGNYVVVWFNTAGSAGTDTSGESIQGQLVGAGGALQGGEFQVNSYTTGNQYNPAVTALPGGEFVVVWSSGTSPSGDSDYSIRGQRFDQNAAPLGQEVQVNSYTTFVQCMPAVAATDDGGFLVVWRSGDFTGGGPDGDRYGIAARAFAADGRPSGSELVANSYTTGFQEAPQVAAAPGRRYVVAWQSNGSFGSDPSWSVQERRFDGSSGLFADGFETGDTSIWAGTEP